MQLSVSHIVDHYFSQQNGSYSHFPEQHIDVLINHIWQPIISIEVMAAGACRLNFLRRRSLVTQGTERMTFTGWHGA